MQRSLGHVTLDHDQRVSVEEIGAWSNAIHMRHLSDSQQSYGRSTLWKDLTLFYH